MFYVYILQSIEDPEIFYTGSTQDIERRLEEHNSSRNTGWTKNRKWKIVYLEAYLSRKYALRREKALKSGRAKIATRKRIDESLMCDDIISV